MGAKGQKQYERLDSQVYQGQDLLQIQVSDWNHEGVQLWTRLNHK